MGEAQIAVLIDYENVGLDSIQALFDQLLDMGRVIVKRAYADWSTVGKKKEQALELGIEAVHYFHSVGSAKNASDICLAIDAVDLLYRSPVDTFVIVSADSDFVPLVSKLRSAGKTVIGAGRREVVSRSLIKSCDRYIYLDELVRGLESRDQPVREDGESLLVRAVTASMDSQGQVLGSRLHQTMTRIDPGFNFRALGYKTFTQFLEASTGIVAKRERSRGGDVTVTLRPVEQPAQPVAQPVEGDWSAGVDAAWSAMVHNPGEAIAAPRAAVEAARVLGVRKLSESPYPTLFRLLKASAHLRSRWKRAGNTIVRL